MYKLFLVEVISTPYFSFSEWLPKLYEEQKQPILSDSVKVWKAKPPKLAALRNYFDQHIFSDTKKDFFDLKKSAPTKGAELIQSIPSSNHGGNVE